MKKTLLLFLLAIQISAFAQNQTKIILDADTGNEVDDLYAIIRALIEPSLEITALNATHWQTSHWTVENSMENSYRINQYLLGLTNMAGKVPSLRGGHARLYDWGDQAQHSAAAYEIIKQAKATPTGEKLNVLALGALTNVASAILIDPSIEPKLRLYWLGTTYDFEENVQRKQDFNCVMDIQATFFLLNSEVEMHIMPVSVASAMTFDFDETKRRLDAKYRINATLVDRWEDHLDGGRQSRTIWDLALVQAFLYPDMAEEVTIKTTKENGNREIFYYKSIDADRMREDFFTKLSAYLEN